MVMSSISIAVAALAFVLGLAIQLLAIRVAHRFKLLDMPTARRRHSRPIPVVGGLGIFATLAVSALAWWALSPAQFTGLAPSALIFGFCVATLIVLGLVDDVRGMGPYPKLGIELLLACLVLAFEPRIHEVCLHWQEIMGPLIWPLAILWIVGITNAINLIDGLDGLAGGTCLLAAVSIFVLSLWSQSDAVFVSLFTALLIPSTLSFLVFNWSPARVFLGDNGSLPLGFTLASMSLMCRPHTHSWIMLASVVLMLGYPILDTGLAVSRRFRKRLPLFKADRSHLHYRILRLGLTVPHTAALLLSISVYLQVSAICVNLMSTASAALGISLVLFSIFSLVFLVRGIERWRVVRLYDISRNQAAKHSPEPRLYPSMTIELETLLEAGMSEEKSRYSQLISALQLMLETHARTGDLVITSNQRLSLIFVNAVESPDFEALVRRRFEEKLALFLKLYNLQCSLSSIPITFERRTLILTSRQATEPATAAPTRETEAA